MTLPDQVPPTEPTLTRDEKLARARRLFGVVAYEPGTHGAFVRSTWAFGALRDGSRHARAQLDAYLAEEGSKAVVAHSGLDPDKLAGWAARAIDGVVFVFVLPVVRRRYLATLLLAEIGVDPALPIPLLHWTPTAKDIASTGRTVYYSPRWPSRTETRKWEPAA